MEFQIALIDLLRDLPDDLGDAKKPDGTTEMDKQAVSWLIDVGRISSTKLADFLMLKPESQRAFVAKNFPECATMFEALLASGDSVLISLYKSLLCLRRMDKP